MASPYFILKLLIVYNIYRRYNNMSTLIHGFGEAELLADRAKKDENGNSLTLTIEEDKVTEIGGKSIGGGGSELPSGGEAGQVLTKTSDGLSWAPVPTELPSSTQYDDKKVLVRTATGYDWKYITPLRVISGILDNASIEIANNTYTNINVSEYNNITFNVSTDSVLDVPNFIIDIHVDDNTALSSLKINVTWTITATQYAGVRTLNCPVDGNTLTITAGENYQLYAVGRCWNVAKFIEPPSEGVEYVLLQNFISGHSIGSAEHGQWVTTVPNDWNDLFQRDSHLSMFDDTTAGATLVDNRSPIDCSKYGISSGTPVATVTGDYGWHTDLAFSFGSGNISTPFTVETFFTCREPYEFNHNFIFYIGAAKYRPENHNELHLALKISSGLNPDDPNDTHIGLYLTDEFTDDHKLLGFEPDGINPGTTDDGRPFFTTWISSWHHFAITADTTNLYVFVDGKLYATLALSTTITNENDVTKTLGEWIGLMPSKILITSFESGEGSGLCGLWAQLAVCKACKWTTDFTVPTEAY